MSSKVERKLAVIMTTDIAEYTALSSKDAIKASELLKIQRNTLKPIIKKYNGSWMKEIGDGLLLTFDSVTNAVECAVEIQKVTKDIEELNLRIGIHEGEVIKQDDDIIGDDVNIAFRIEPFSAVGGIAISHKIQQAISSNKEFETKYIGKPQLKGVSQKIEVYCIISHELPATNISKVSAKLEKESRFNIFTITGSILTFIGIIFWISVILFDLSYSETIDTPSVIVIPFENKGSDEDDFYAYSISADIISDITNAGLIRVASLNQIEDLESLSIAEKAKKLDIRYIVTGTLWKMKEIFQLNIEIFDTELSNVISTHRIEKQWDELPSVKGNISKIILNNLKIDTKQNLTKLPTTNLESYKLYLDGKFRWKTSSSKQDSIDARSLVKESIRLDQNNIEAISWLATTYTSTKDFKMAIKLNEQAYDLADLYNDKHWIGKTLMYKGEIYSRNSQSNRALESFKKSIPFLYEVNDKRNQATVLSNIGKIFSYTDDVDSSIFYYEKSIEIENDLGDTFKLRHIQNAYRNLGHRYDEKENYNESILYFKKYLSISKKLNDIDNIYNAYLLIGKEYEALYQYDQSLKYYLEFYDGVIIKNLITPEGSTVPTMLIHIGQYFEAIGDYKKAFNCFTMAQKIINAIDLNDLQVPIEYHENFKFIINSSRVRSISGIGYYYFILGDYEKSLKYFKESYNINNEYLKNTILLYLNYKILGISADKKPLYTLIKANEDTHYINNFYLFKLFGESEYIKVSFNQIQQKIDKMNKDIKSQFLSYPIPKAIVEEYNKVFKE